MEVQYDAERAAEKTALTAVFDRQLAKKCRRHTRCVRLKQRVALSGNETYDDSMLKRRLDVETVVEMLSDRQQRVCELLSQGCSKAAIARELGCGWHTVDRIVRDIRGQFEAHGFGED